jgi:hypothetical protein
LWAVWADGLLWLDGVQWGTARVHEVSAMSMRPRPSHAIRARTA